MFFPQHVFIERCFGGVFLKNQPWKRNGGSCKIAMLRHLWLLSPLPRVCLKLLRGSSRSKLISLQAELTRLMAMFPPLPRSQGWPSPRMLLIRGFVVFFSQGLMGLIWSVKILWRNTSPGVKIVKSYLSCLRIAITPRTVVPKVGWQCFQVPANSKHVQFVFTIKEQVSKRYWFCWVDTVRPLRTSSYAAARRSLRRLMRLSWT